MANFNQAKFDDWTYFLDATFASEAHFRAATFASVALFVDAKFGSVAYFNWAKFDDKANFSEATFASVADFREATFDDKAHFVQARFKGTVRFINSDFRQGVDFRQTYFDSVQTLYLENIIFPEGRLRFHWQQFEGKDSLRIKLQYPPADSLRQEHYTRIEIIYHRLRDNFLAQADKASADAVMYELGWQRKEILGQFWWTMYGFFFGAGFQPWRFLVFVVVPLILLFALLWYIRYYDVLQNVVFKSELENASGLSEQRGGFFQRAWHSLFFSFSVLLSIRYNKSWIVEHKKFLFWASLEWAMGILLFVTFALLVKGARFGFIRDLLGF